MTNRHQIALVTPVVLISVMYPIFHGLASLFDGSWRIGWYLGLATYWLLWGAIYPLLMLGRASLWTII